MTTKKRRIALVPIGEVPEIASKSIAANILGYLNIDADILPPTAHPAYAYDEKRMQYHAGVILKTLASEVSHDYHGVLGVLDVDIFVPILTHVFGEAQQGGRSAIVSVFRLRKNPDGSSPPLSLVLERAAKVAVHEVGHLFDLQHCMDERCLMHFSGGLEDVDKAPLYFCRYCTVFIRDALQKWGIVE